MAGVMLISGGIHVGPVIDDDLRTALFIPTRAAAALHHKKLAADLQKDVPSTLRTIETWALNEYAPALKRLASLSDQERESIAASLARFTGLDPTLIDRKRSRRSPAIRRATPSRSEDACLRALTRATSSAARSPAVAPRR